MSYANVKSFILILLVAATQSAIIREKRGYGSSSGSGGYGSSSSGGLNGGGFGGLNGGGLNGGGFNGLADIGVDIKEITNIDVGANQGFGGFEDIGLGDISNGNMGGELQQIVDSVGGFGGGGQNIGDIGLTASDFSFGSGSNSGSSYGKGSNSYGK